MRDIDTHIVDIKKYLLFLHAFTGCDSTSAIFGKGKVSLLKLFRKCELFRSASKAFMESTSTVEQVGNAAIMAFKAIYSSDTDLSLQKIRYNKYMDMSCQGVIQPERLPPTERAAFFHGLRQ